MNVIDIAAGGKLGASQAKTYTDNKLAGLTTNLTYKGSVATVTDLPASGNEQGDCYNVTDGSGVYVWNGTAWGSASIAGPQGPQGATGTAAGITDATATVDASIGTPSVTVTTSGPDTAKQFNFAFHNLKGEKGTFGRFLSLWNCSTGLPVTNPTTMPYTYSSGDYYRVGTVATGFVHTLSLSGTTTDKGTYEGTYTLSLSLTTNSGTQLTTVPALVAAFEDSERYSATGTLTTTDETYTVASVLKWNQDDVDYLALCDAGDSKIALVLASTTQTDTVTGGITNYKPNGSSYDGTASTTVETGTVLEGNVYFYDGTNWILQSTYSEEISWGQIDGTLSNQTDLAAALASKVDQVAGKGLSTNDYDATEKQKVADAYGDKHTHANKANLDLLTAAKTTGWDNSIGWLGNAIGLRGWNQLVKNGNFASTDGWSCESTVSLSVSNNIATVTGTNTSSGIYRSSTIDVTGHKLLISLYAKGDSATIIANVFGATNVVFSSVSSEWAHFSSIVTPTAQATRFGIYSGSANFTLYFKNVMVIDLTTLFGAGNEPTTVAEFRAMFPADYYPYHSNVNSLADLNFTIVST